MLSEKKIKYFERLLNQQLQAIENRTDETPVSTMIEDIEQTNDFTDQASLETDMDLSIHIKERDSKLIIKIKDALERIKNGTYGICEECGEEISEKRLKARPVATVCIDCKKRLENHEKQRGL